MLSGQEYSVNPYVTKGVVRRHSNTAERTPDMVRKNLKTKKIVEGPKIKQPMNGLKFSWIVGLSGKYFQIHSCLKFSADVHTESISRAIVADLRQGKNRKFEAAIFRRSAFARAYMSDGRPFPPQRFSEAKGRRPPPSISGDPGQFYGPPRTSSIEVPKKPTDRKCHDSGAICAWPRCDDGFSTSLFCVANPCWRRTHGNTDMAFVRRQSDTIAKFRFGQVKGT